MCGCMSMCDFQVEYTGGNLNSTKLLDCAVIGLHVCALIRSNTRAGI